MNRAILFSNNYEKDHMDSPFYYVESNSKGKGRKCKYYISFTSTPNSSILPTTSMSEQHALQGSYKTNYTFIYVEMKSVKI